MSQDGFGFCLTADKGVVGVVDLIAGPLMINGFGVGYNG